jgi:hypothetical protein
MAQEQHLTEKERDVLVQCLADAYEALRVIPGAEHNGPALVWLADHLLDIRRREEGWHEVIANGR